MDELTRLFVAARDGDRMALTEAIRASAADVWRFTAHLAGAADADDLTQDTYLRAWRALPEFRAESSARVAFSSTFFDNPAWPAIRCSSARIAAPSSGR